MRFFKSACTAFAAVLLTASLSASAHHSFAGQFDRNLPVFFTEPWSVTSQFRRSEHDLLMNICTENNRDINHFITGD